MSSRSSDQHAGTRHAHCRLFATLGAVSGFLTVAIGAFGAHGLRGRLSPDSLALVELAVRYQTTHALALFAAVWVHARWPSRASAAAAWLFVAGALVFCGSLYALAMTGARWFGAITPLGGTALLAGWACLAWACWQGPSHDDKENR